MMRIPKVADFGKLVLYFGAQSFMNIYMSWALHTSVTVPKGHVIPGTNMTLTEDVTGCPAGFALTAFQQVVSFIIFIIFFCSVYFTPYRYVPKKLTSCFEVFCVVVFGCVFALNIALNNVSLTYISIAVNLIIRSCLPLSTLLSQHLLSLCKLYPHRPCVLKEVILMCIGVICAFAFTMAKHQAAKGHSGSEMFFGSVICVASLFCGSLNLALAGVLGETKLNVYDTVAYMAIPATIFLSPIILLVQKPVPPAWQQVFGKDMMTDFEVLTGTWGLNKMTIFWLFMSGVFSFAYNIIQFSIVHALSPSMTAFGGNFNKAALVFLTLLLPFLRVHQENPEWPWNAVLWGAVILNIAAFSGYSYLQIQAKRQKEAEAQKKQKMLEVTNDSEEEDDDSEDDDSDEDYSSSDNGKLC